MPASFESPLPRGIDVWLSGDRGVPRTFPFGGDLTAVRDSHIIFVVGRLAPGATREVAQQELSATDGRSWRGATPTPTPASASTSSRCTSSRRRRAEPLRCCSSPSA